MPPKVSGGSINPFTVTATMPTNDGISALKVLVLDGAVETGGAANNGSSATTTWSVTPNFSHSLPVFVFYDTSGSSVYTAASNNTILDQQNPISGGDTYVDGYYSGTVTAATPITLGATTASSTINYCSYEIQPSGGSTPTIDASTTALATVNGGNDFITSATFTPPASSVLVAMFASDFSSGTTGTATPTVTDTSGLGLTWVQRSAENLGSFSAVWIFTTTLPSGGGGGAVAIPPVQRRSRSSSTSVEGLRSQRQARRVPTALTPPPASVRSRSSSSDIAGLRFQRQPGQLPPAIAVPAVLPQSLRRQQQRAELDIRRQRSKQQQIAPPGIRYNTGTTAVVTGITSGATSAGTLTIPASVLVGDVILVTVFSFTFAGTAPVNTLTSSATSPTLVGIEQQCVGNAIYATAALWVIVAGASDPGATLTFGATNGATQWWFNVGLVAYTGANAVTPIDVNGGNAQYIGGTGSGSVTTPSLSTGVNGDWQVQFVNVGPPSGNNFNTIPSGLTLREQLNSGANAGLLLDIADSNGSVGPAGTAIGNTLWTCSANAGNSWLTSFTVGLAPQLAVEPAAVPLPPVRVRSRSSSTGVFGIRHKRQAQLAPPQPVLNQPAIPPAGLPRKRLPVPPVPKRNASKPPAPPSGGGGNISVVQVGKGAGFGTTATFSAGVTLGNWILVSQPGYSSVAPSPSSGGVPTVGGVTPTVYSQLISQQSPAGGNDVYIGLWLIQVTAALAGATTVTIAITNGSSAGPVAIETTGWTGTPTVDQSTSQGGTSTAVSSGTTSAISFSPELVVGVNVTYGSGQGSGPTGYTNTDGSGSGYAFLGYQIPTSAGGTYTYADTAVSSINWAAGIVTLYNPGGAPAAVLPPAGVRSRSSSSGIFGLRSQRRAQLAQVVPAPVQTRRPTIRPAGWRTRPQTQMPIGAPRVPVEQKQGQRARFPWSFTLRRQQAMPIGAPRVPIEQKQGERQRFPFGIAMRRQQQMPIGAPRVPVYQQQGQRRRLLFGLRSQRQPGLTPPVVAPVQGTRNRPRLFGGRTRPQPQLVPVSVIVIAPTPPPPSPVRARILSWRTRPQSQVAPAAVVLVPPVIQTQAGIRARQLAWRTRSQRAMPIGAPRVPAPSHQRPRTGLVFRPRNVRAMPPVTIPVPAAQAQRSRYRIGGLQRRQAKLGQAGAAVPLVQQRPPRTQALRRPQRSTQLAPPVIPAVAPKANVRTTLQRFVGWIRRRPQAQRAPVAVSGPTHFGTANLTQATTLFAYATTSTGLGNLWEIYLNAKTTADAATQLYIDARMAGGYSVGTLYFGDAYQKQAIAGQAYENWYAAWRVVNPAPPSGPPQAPPDFPNLF